MSRASSARRELERYEATRPAAYQSRYGQQLADLTGELEALGAFDYDQEADPDYRRYERAVRTNARRAGQNAAAEASTRTGGYTNSWAATASQNAYQAGMDSLDDILSGLYDQALAEYTANKNDLYTRLGLVQSAEQQDYSRYQAELQNWQQGLVQRQQQYQAAAQSEQQRTSDWIDLGLGALSLLASIAPLFFI